MSAKMKKGARSGASIRHAAITQPASGRDCVLARVRFGASSQPWFSSGTLCIDRGHDIHTHSGGITLSAGIGICTTVYFSAKVFSNEFKSLPQGPQDPVVRRPTGVPCSGRAQWPWHWLELPYFGRCGTRLGFHALSGHGLRPMHLRVVLGVWSQWHGGPRPSLQWGETALPLS